MEVLFSRLKALRNETLQCRCNIIGPEAVGSWLAFPCYAAIPVNHIEPVGPSGIGSLRGIIEIIDQGRKLYPEILDTGVGYGSSFFEGVRISKYNIFLFVNRH